jgi:ABC-type siderophore export system fused ATPase/permease subunit
MPILFSILVMVIVLGLIYWVVTLLPLPEPFKQIAIVIVVVICLLYLLSLLFGFAGPFPVFHGGYR